MGQATADLPDPTKDLSTAHAGGADDLLAQLAGDEIDRLLAESDVEPVAAEKAAIVDAEMPVAPPAGVQSHAAAVEVTPIEIPHASEIAAVLDHSQPAAAHDPEPELEVRREFATPPLWLKPLMWLNAPLDALPDSMRDLIGKIAIATTANALAVLAYVALFHRHH